MCRAATMSAKSCAGLQPGAPKGVPGCNRGRQKVCRAATGGAKRCAGLQQGALKSALGCNPER